MDKDTRNAIERATQRARKLIEEDFREQLEGAFDVHRNGTVAAKAGAHLSARQACQRERIVAAIEHKRAAGMNAAEAGRDYLRDAAFTTLNRFVALKMLEARELVQECITKGEQSAGYREFCGMAAGLPLLPDSAGYRLYIESLFDELSTEVKVLFDRRDPSSVLWPKRATFEQLLEILNASELSGVWGEDETIGWVYQFFNGQDERRKMREESQAPRNSRELAVRNQFFTPRYVVQFLTDNTLGCIWYEMRAAKTALIERCEYMVRKPGEEFVPRAPKDPRDLRVLDPACGSGHFLLYAFDLLLKIYEEAWGDSESPKSEATGKTLVEDYPSVHALQKAVPGLVLAHNLHGVDIDPRCAQIAQLALWMRAQKAYRDFGIGRAERPQIRRSNIVVAEPLVADEQIAKEFVAKLGDVELGRVFMSLVESLNLAGDLGLLLRVEQLVARQANRGQTGNLFAPPEERIRSTLARFVREEGRANAKRRLFIDDAAQGVALLGLATQKYDVALMNPPFGEPTAAGREHLVATYPEARNDIYAAFVVRALQLSESTGALVSRAFLTGRDHREFRRRILGGSAQPGLWLLADLGSGVLDATVQTVALCLGAGHGDGLVYIDAKEVTNKDSSLRRACSTGNTRIFPREVFRSLPTAEMLVQLEVEQVESVRSSVPISSHVGTVTHGLRTNDDERFVRLAWEVGMPDPARWARFSKGGEYSWFTGETHLLLNRYRGGVEMAALAVDKDGNVAATRNSSKFYGCAATSFSRRSQKGFSARRLRRDCVFSDKTGVIVPFDEEWIDLLPAILFSRRYQQLIAARSKFGSYEIGAIRQLPEPVIVSRIDARRTARRVYFLMDLLEQFDETTSRFLVPFSVGFMKASYLSAVNDSIGDLMFAVGLDADEDSSGAFIATVRERLDELSRSGVWVSFFLGVAFGRWNSHPLRNWPLVFESCPDDYDPLAPASLPPALATQDSPCVVALADDDGTPHDVAHAILKHWHLWRNEAPENVPLPPEAEVLRARIAHELFEEHGMAYSRSRRRAPIYWQLATPSASYSVWLYIHAFSNDTLFRVQNDYVVPKLAHEERRLESLTSELRDGANAAQRKQVAAQEAVVDELRAFLDEVKRVAPLWKPNLDDGVIINFAPLWRLVPQNKSWQNELKSTWEALCEGKYDWAHLAMHLWPERVVPKCATDRSLAIAHGLEDVFWVEGTDGKWTARKTPTRTVDELVKERTSFAAKAALKNLLEAPVPSGKAAKTKKATRRGNLNA
jgi:hypothetical protein